MLDVLRTRCENCRERVVEHHRANGKVYFKCGPCGRTTICTIRHAEAMHRVRTQIESAFNS